MHRSGTSAVARSLVVLGVDLSDDLLPADPANPKGYWEDRDVHLLNEEILAALGHKWDTIEPIAPGEFESARLADFKVRAVRLLRERLSDTDCFGLKDPRFCVLLPFWKEILGRVGAQPGYVVVSRNPMSVVRSLSLRDGHHPVKSYYLWLIHMLQALRHTAGTRRVVVDYDSLMSEPAAQLSRIGCALGLKFDEGGPEFRAFSSEFLDEGLRHTHFGKDDLLVEKDCPPKVVEAYSLLERLALDVCAPEDPDVAGEVEEVWTEVERMKPVFGLVDFFDKRLDAHRAEIDELSVRSRKLETDLEFRKRQISDLEDELRVRDRRLGEAVEIGQAQEAAASVLRERVERLGTRLREMETHANSDAIKRGEAERKLAEVIESRSWKLTKPLRFVWRIRRGDWGAVRAGVKDNLPPAFRRRLEGVAARLGPRDKASPRRMGKQLRKNSAFPLDREESPDPEARADLQARISRSSVDDQGSRAESHHFMPLSLRESPPDELPAKVIAFYLPQFHPIPENDAWWGRGFTEWHNVSQAEPHFEGHHQPRIPGELGYYDLRVPEVQRRQVELARKYGIYGFCFYFYWFSGRRLLEFPLERFMTDCEIDFPFSLCWANENWTRRWDGEESEILLSARQSPQDDVDLIEDVTQIMAHPNYIRVGERPLFLVYRPQLLTDPQTTVARWRERCIHAGLGDPFLVAMQYKEAVDPRPLGFDAAIEFPPNTPVPLRIANDEVELKSQDFAGLVYDYKELVESMTYRDIPPYMLIRTVAPGWDNTARRRSRKNPHVFAGAEPSLYEEWLKRALRFSLSQPDEDSRLVFVNAWNEWGESATWNRMPITGMPTWKRPRGHSKRSVGKPGPTPVE